MQQHAIATDKLDLPDRKTGCAPAISDTRAIQFATYVGKDVSIPPKETKFWPEKKHLPVPMFGNDEWGDCTRASQAHATIRTERLEQRKTVIISDEEVIRVYLDMTKRLYGGGDVGAYETDALSEWRKPDLTFRDNKGRPMTIDAFAAVNHRNLQEFQIAMALSKSRGLKVCLNLPAAWMRQDELWDIPTDQNLTGPWVPGSWGGHSLYADDYDQWGVFMPTWNFNIKISWRAFAIYCSECHLIIDSFNQWKKQVSKSEFDVDAMASDINSVSPQKIAI